MKVDLGIWSWLTQAVVVLVALAVLIFIILAYRGPIQDNVRMRREILRLDNELQKQEEISRQMRADLDALRNDPATIARLAREKLGYAKPDEVILRFETNSVNSSAR